MDNRHAQTLARIAKSRARCHAMCNAPAVTQWVVRIHDEMARAVDALVDEGAVASRSEAVREALDARLDRSRRERLAAEIVRGYRESPQADEGAWPDAATVATISDEAW